MCELLLPQLLQGWAQHPNLTEKLAPTYLKQGDQPSVLVSKNDLLLINVELGMEREVHKMVFRTIGARQTARILGARVAPLCPTQKEAFSWCPAVDLSL